MRFRFRSMVAVAVGVLSLVFTARAVSHAQQAAQAPPNRIVIEEFVVPPNRAVGEAIAEISQLIKDMRATGEYKSVRLYLHEWGSELALYVITEPRSWASIEAGWEKLTKARPDLMTSPYKFGRHSDQILAEVPVP